MPDLELLRRLAPPVEPADPDVVDRAHARMTEAAAAGRCGAAAAAACSRHPSSRPPRSPSRSS